MRKKKALASPKQTRAGLHNQPEEIVALSAIPPVQYLMLNGFSDSLPKKEDLFAVPSKASKTPVWQCGQPGCKSSDRRERPTKASYIEIYAVPSCLTPKDVSCAVWTMALSPPIAISKTPPSTRHVVTRKQALSNRIQKHDSAVMRATEVYPEHGTDP